MIISDGINIYREDIEEMLLNYPRVKEASVVREGHSAYGEVPVAKVVLKSGITVVSA